MSDIIFTELSRSIEANMTPAELGIPEIGPYLYDIFDAAGRADAVALACTLAGPAGWLGRPTYIAVSAASHVQ